MTVVPSCAATSAALNSSTSRSTSTARCRGGRTCIAATSASRMSARIPVSNRASGNGCSQGMSNAGVSGAPGSSLGAPSPDGNGRRARPSSADRHALVAIRYSQVRTDARVRSYRSRAFHARSIVSCTRSSASWNEPSIR